MANDTIVAVATPPGLGGVGVVRLSGPQAFSVGERVAGRQFEPRKATLARFVDASGTRLDEGLAIAFPEGQSYTGESVLELQGHGSPVALQLLVNACIDAGARLARPGEFTERAFENGRIDLAQAEAVADLIASASEAAVKGAARSLGGEFSRTIDALAANMLELRVYLEADIDFPDEEVDVLADDSVLRRIEALAAQVDEVLQAARRGVRLAQGATVAIVGAPNAGKSSLLNALAGDETAIVADVPGTTRDVLRVDLLLNGLAVRLVDTAGLRDTEDSVEQEGVRRALAQLAEADLVIHLRDLSAPEVSVPGAWLQPARQIVEVWNKADLVAAPPPDAISAQRGDGLEALRQRLTGHLGYQADASAFTARQRHVDALLAAKGALQDARELTMHEPAPELIAEEVRLAHRKLGEIVGEVTSDALLGEIFSTFCIGK